MLNEGEIELSEWSSVGSNFSRKYGLSGSKYSTLAEYLEENKPYFRLKFDATDDYTDNSTSPLFCIYVSPLQWQTIFELCDQETLEAHCDEIIEQGQAF